MLVDLCQTLLKRNMDQEAKGVWLRDAVLHEEGFELLVSAVGRGQNARETGA